MTSKVGKEIAKKEIGICSASFGIECGKMKKSGKKYQTGACCHCKRRRKKCNGQYPTCSNCRSASVVCTMIDLASGREIPRNYVEKLENKISDLERTLNSGKNRRNSTDSAEQKADMVEKPESQSEDEGVDELAGSGNKDLARDVGYITLAAAAEPRYLGASSAYSIAKVITHSIHYYQQKQRSVTVGKRNLLNSRNAHVEERQEQLLALEINKPNEETGRKLLKAYHRGVQCQYPFLDWSWVLRCFDEVIKKETQNDISSFFIYMIFAIGSQLIEGVSRTPSTLHARSYYNKAFEHITSIIEDTSIRSVQVYLILGIFSQKMPCGSSIWQTTGLAIRTSVALGLHRSLSHINKKSRQKEVDRASKDLRARVFWCAYSLERINGLVLGRPFGLSDVDIDVPFPDSEEYIVANHVFKLRKIQSSICVFVYGPRHFNEEEDEVNITRHQIMLELSSWKSTFPVNNHAKCTWETDNWCTISHHNSVLLLLRPVVLEVSEKKGRTPASTIEWFKIFTQSASAICLNYKELHSIQKLSYTWLALHCVFIAGLSFLYCIWLDCSLKILQWRKKSTIYDTISACSNILYVLAERWDSATVFRNSFEQMSRSILSKVENEDEETDAENDTLSPKREIMFKEFSYTADRIRNSYNSGSLRNLQPLHEAQEYGADLGPTDGVSFSIPSSVSSNSTPTGSVNNSFDRKEKMDDSAGDSIWDFLNNEGDQFLRTIFYDIEETLQTTK
ncbi:hypothetical protein HG535_0F06270 [Zygotorulaspora mrakii]|uniref:Zn(2)-C6 fungal-type domain-containing protein n=1 Tax=Zygotorulaspora mrakii TaxID=42260 RepID=A0A7H9B5X7_ZYGMR|nr:uncharacterized protein HG535_0F06270 [Zygotorulaspora mrakii]QLG74115.1 hypothetical protein HG535_0F06270 [Zygotorulaspora mrakii]